MAQTIRVEEESYIDGRCTKVPVRVFRTSAAASRYVARVIAELIRERAAEGKYAVLGLATGSTPVGVYRELIRMHREEGLDFSNVITFNLDEYYPIERTRLQSYWNWMHRMFFNHVNIPEHQRHIPDGTVPEDQVEEYCQRYEQMIQEAGGLDLQLLGIGRTGHVGFNEPGSTVDSRTRLVTLDPVTRRDAASDFFGEENVPLQAITMGVGTILSARKIILMAFGEHKASIVKQAAEGPVTESIAASFLQTHPDALFVLDQAAAAKLTEFETPWLVGSVEWTPALIKRALIWLCLKQGKALLKLEDNDFRTHGLHELLREHGPAQRLAQEVFQQMMSTICWCPTGADRKRVVVFSPHPDDDVISMGGTLLHLTQSGHDVHVAYMTSGNIAVFDHDVDRYLDFVLRFLRAFEIPDKRVTELSRRVRAFLSQKRPGDVDSAEVREIKTLIREIEARAAALSLGVREENLHFLRLPFYETGAVEKRPISEEDLAIIERLLAQIQPHDIYLAGDLSDPHGTHRVCADAILTAIRRGRYGPQPLNVWLYRGAWQEWEPHEIDKAVPLTPQDLRRKRNAIFMHETQKDEAMFPGPYDDREFWQRAQDRNMHTAALYNQLGLPEYFALEGFVRWDPEQPL
jgi:glucosamine-6-phosphate deaminase